MPTDLRASARLDLPGGSSVTYCSLPLLARDWPAIARLPVCLRIVLEAVARHLDGVRVRESDIAALADWQPRAPRTAEVPFTVARVLLQDFTGVPLLVDLAAMRTAIARVDGDVHRVQPRVPVDLVIDHSVQVDVAAAPEALARNHELEYRRNRERYRFLKWGQQAFTGVRIVPPGFGICHQVNLEYLAPGVVVRDGVACFDSLVGTDSHTTMINGLGVVGWGVGGIEAEAAMLGQPVSFLLPDVVGCRLTGQLPVGATATDLVLRVTELLRAAKVVGSFVEFHGPGAASLAVPDRATIANMAPEYGATIGFFPPDEQGCRYLAATGRDEATVELFRRYHQAQGVFGMPADGVVEYSRVLDLDLATIVPSVAGPRRPQDRIALDAVAERFRALLTSDGADGYGRPAAATIVVRATLGAAPAPAGGGAQEVESVPDGAAKDTSTLTETEMVNNRPTANRPDEPAQPARAATLALRDGSVVIAAITSCTNTSNPAVMLAAGLLARNAVAAGLRPPAWVKTSLAPGSRAVTGYLERTGLQASLDALGFHTVGYGCTTCIGNSGPLDARIEELIQRHGLVVAAVLSGNRNFEARVHQSVKANFLASPPLVVAYALAGRVDLDFAREPLGTVGGRPVMLRDLWPAADEIEAMLGAALDPAAYRAIYARVQDGGPLWDAIPARIGATYEWDSGSTYVREPPYFSRSMPAAAGEVRGARALAILGDSVTTDHISPAGAIRADSPAGRWLRAQGVEPEDFNSYGARRGNHEVMVRGTFANVRIRNLMAPGHEGGVTPHHPDGDVLPIHDAAERYRQEGVPLVVIGGAEYGTGSSRDWAAKGTRLLGVRAVIARSFERIHRANLVGMGVLPCEFPEDVDARSLDLDGSEIYDLLGVAKVGPRQAATLAITRSDGRRHEVPVTVRVDTPIEAEYLALGGILPYVLRGLEAGRG